MSSTNTKPPPPAGATDVWFSVIIVSPASSSLADVVALAIVNSNTLPAVGSGMSVVLIFVDAGRLSEYPLPPLVIDTPSIAPPVTV